MGFSKFAIDKKTQDSNFKDRAVAGPFPISFSRHSPTSVV